MPYKTKFREVRLPKNAKELRAIGDDANSMRSLGAAFYMFMSGVLPQDKVGQCICDLYPKVIEPVVSDSNPISLPGERKQWEYAMQGVQKAARKAGDAQTAEYVSRKLAEMKWVGA